MSVKNQVEGVVKNLCFCEEDSDSVNYVTNYVNRCFLLLKGG